jgi:hypothetical protein
MAKLVADIPEVLMENIWLAQPTSASPIKGKARPCACWKPQSVRRWGRRNMVETEQSMSLARDMPSIVRTPTAFAGWRSTGSGDPISPQSSQNRFMGRLLLSDYA